MINISASLIKDYLVCPKRVQYRISTPEQALQTAEMTIGNIVHKVLETSWDSREQANLIIEQEVNRYNLHTGFEKIIKCVDNYFNNYRNLFETKPTTEKYFKLKYDTGVNLVGRIDAIYNGMVIDWKTGSAPPTALNRDIQFLIYNIAYKKLYGSYPAATYYISLATPKIYTFTLEKEILTEFEQMTLPYVIDNLRNGVYPRTGLYGYKSCNYCMFQNVCYGELNYDE